MDKDKKDMLTGVTDQELLDRFFAQAQMTVADDGFSTRVMQQIAALRATNAHVHKSSLTHLTRWNFWLNFIAGMTIVVLLFLTGFFGGAKEWLQMAVHRIVVGIVTFDPDELLVQLMLFLHRVVNLLPSGPQLLAIALSIMALMILGVQRLAQMEQSGQ